jgi:hypothetical protein
MIAGIVSAREQRKRTMANFYVLNTDHLPHPGTLVTNVQTEQEAAQKYLAEMVEEQPPAGTVLLVMPQMVSAFRTGGATPVSVPPYV